jgi:heptosyltransferase-2
MDALVGARLVLCNDSGAMHVASALGVPTMSVFGSTEPQLTGPMGPRARVLRHHVPCSPCFLRECPLDFGCMQGIPAEAAIVAAEALLR